jgi:hypothetical protein
MGTGWEAPQAAKDLFIVENMIVPVCSFTFRSRGHGYWVDIAAGVGGKGFTLGDDQEGASQFQAHPYREMVRVVGVFKENFGVHYSDLVQGKAWRKRSVENMVDGSVPHPLGVSIPGVELGIVPERIVQWAVQVRGREECPMGGPLVSLVEITGEEDGVSVCAPLLDKCFGKPANELGGGLTLGVGWQGRTVLVSSDARLEGGGASGTGGWGEVGVDHADPIVPCTECERREDAKSHRVSVGVASDHEAGPLAGDNGNAPSHPVVHFSARVGVDTRRWELEESAVRHAKV